MAAYSLDMRKKILAAYQAGNTSVRKVAARFMVSPGVVQRLLKQTRATGNVSSRPPGPAPGQGILSPHIETVVGLVESHPDWTLTEYCEALWDDNGIEVSPATLCRFLQRHRLTLKKRRSAMSNGKR
jgi:transposase